MDPYSLGTTPSVDAVVSLLGNVHLPLVVSATRAGANPLPGVWVAKGVKGE